MTRPSICFVAPNAYPLLAERDEMDVVGGAELQQVLLAKGLAMRGYQVKMICLDYGQPEAETISGVSVIRAHRHTSGWPVLRFIYPRLTSILRCLREADADIYYSRAASHLTGVIAWYCRRRSKMAIFAGAGDPDFDLRTSRLRFRRDSWLHEYGIRHSHMLIAQNEEQCRRCKLNFGRVPEVVRNCYPEPELRNREPGETVLWVGTIRRLKRPEIFLELARRLPDVPFRMIGGPDPWDRAFFSRIEQEAKSIVNLDFRGFVPYREIDEYFDRARIIINTSESEGFPNTFLQAWSRGVPSVSFVDCGARYGDELVGEVAVDLPEMTKYVTRLLEDDEYWSSRGRLCRSYYAEHHTPSSVLDSYEALFLALEANRPGIAGRG